ncbi:MAG TPA: hypothetical protein VE641_18865 [Chthoniobacterales bacterium]|nr:hypothetical protein [Chthoniobacterales bacterium]
MNRYAWYQAVDQITVGASTNLMAGWLLARSFVSGAVVLSARN